jgi:glycosyltransferase involved in cell wall biosynthesis
VKKILMLLDGRFPPDDRVEKEAISLIKEGFIVNILCVSYKPSPLSVIYKGINIFRFYYPEKIHKKFSAAYLTLPMHYLIWRMVTNKFIIKNQVDILHIHDLPLTNIGTLFKKKFGIKLVCDQHEYFSNWIGHTAHYNTILGKIVNKYSNWKQYEKRQLKNADLIFTVEEPLREIYINKVGIDSNRIISVPNTPLKYIFNKKNVNQEVIKKYKGHFVIFYAGSIDILRGIHFIIRDLRKLEKQIPNIKFVLAGRFAKNNNMFTNAKELGVDKLIEFVGWQTPEMLASYIAASNICVFTPISHNEEINKTIATKIYQYAFMHKPIIISRVKLMKEFVEKNKLGVSVDPEEPDSIYNAVMQLLGEDNQSYNKTLSNLYCWETTIKPALAMYKQL